MPRDRGVSPEEWGHLGKIGQHNGLRLGFFSTEPTVIFEDGGTFLKSSFV
jgi:hypothetical protein